MSSPVAQTSKMWWVSFLLVQSTNRPRTTESGAVDCTTWQSGTGCNNVGRSGSQPDLWEAKTCRRTAGTEWNPRHQLHQGPTVQRRPGRPQPERRNVTFWYLTLDPAFKCQMMSCLHTDSQWNAAKHESIVPFAWTRDLLVKAEAVSTFVFLFFCLLWLLNFSKFYLKRLPLLYKKLQSGQMKQPHGAGKQNPTRTHQSGLDQ